MSYKYMRMIVMYDLVMNNKDEIREYTKFRNNLIRDGFIMVQESIYSRICINKEYVKWTEKKIKKFLPRKGNVRVLTVTEKQYNSMKIFLGTKSMQEKYTDDRRLIEI